MVQLCSFTVVYTVPLFVGSLDVCGTSRSDIDDMVTKHRLKMGVSTFLGLSA